MPQDNNKPYISSAKIGYIYENAVATTLVLNQNLDAPLQIKISDRDLVSNFMNSSKMKYSNEHAHSVLPKIHVRVFFIFFLFQMFVFARNATNMRTFPNYN